MIEDIGDRGGDDDRGQAGREVLAISDNHGRARVRGDGPAMDWIRRNQGGQVPEVYSLETVVAAFAAGRDEVTILDVLPLGAVLDYPEVRDAARAAGPAPGVDKRTDFTRTLGPVHVDPNGASVLAQVVRDALNAVAEGETDDDAAIALHSAAVRTSIAGLTRLRRLLK